MPLHDISATSLLAVACCMQGIRKVCSVLLDLKDAVENLSGNMHSKYAAFLR